MPDGNDTNRRLQEEVRTLREKVATLEALLAQPHTSGDEGSMGDVAREHERLIDIIESTTDFVATSTPDGRVQFMNRAGRRLVGLPDDAEVGRMHVHDFHPPSAAEFVMKVGIPSCVAQGSFSHETHLVHRDGTEIPVSQVILSHKLPTGDVQYLSTIIRDMTETHRIAEALAESEKKFRTIIQASPMGVHMYELESEGRLVFIGANPAADALLGVDNTQFIGKTVEEAFPPLAETEIPKRYREAASEGTPWQTSQVNYEDEQIAGAFEVQAFQTSPNRMAAMFLEITTRLKAEESLRESEQRYRELFESMAQGVVYHDLEGRIVMVNPAAERILGLGRDELIGRTSTDPRWRAIREDRSELPAQDHPAMVSLRTSRPANSVMAVFNVADGAYRWIDMYATPQFRPGETSPYQVFTTFTDITERRLAHRRREELEHQLRQAQKMEAVGQLAGGIAHDFNNLLTTIAGYSELIWEDSGLDGRLRSDLDEIRKAADRAAALTEQLLAFSRKQIISPRILDLNTRIREAHNLLSRMIGETIDLNLELSDDPCTVEADPSQIDQILINLAVNARDAMPEGGRVTISTAHVSLDEKFCRTAMDVEPGEFITITVADTGNGMSQETLGRIFEPFFTTKEHGKGTGLGLSTVYGIVKQNRGAIKISSQPKEGTTAEVFLPCVDQEIHDDVRTTPPTDLTGNETILLVEDEDAVRSLTEKLLRSRGYNVLLAGTPERAIQTCREHDGVIDLLLTDVVMPQMNGRALYHLLKKIRPGLRALYMSGYAADVIVRHGVLEEDTNFVAKPFTTLTLAAKVREALEKEA
jgi:two-component system cell cycle sensor histidine kinase/response regulator CckA